MTKLTIEQTPAVSLPRRFLTSAPYWGILTGVLLLCDGQEMLRSRWHPATLAATHAFTLGVLGNAIFGSVLQFLPAAVGVRLRGATRFGVALHVLLNVGIVLLVAGLRWSLPGVLPIAASVLLTAFALLAAMTVPGLITAPGQRILRAGLSAALVAALLTAALGALLSLGLAGWTRLPLIVLADVHAAWGLLGWILLLTATVARVVLPMFQGTATIPAQAVGIWSIAVLLFLLTGSIVWLCVGHDQVLRNGVGIGAASFALVALWLQWRSPRRRNAALRAFWRTGLLALAASGLTLQVDHGDGMLAGVLGIGIALPLLTVGMQLQICAFLGWIDLQRRCGRGVHLPGVQQLLSESDQIRVLRIFQLSALLLPLAVLWPSAWLVRIAACSMLLSYSVLWSTQTRVGRRVDDFLRCAGDRA